MIFKYEVLNPIANKNKPFFNEKRNQLIFKIDKKYSYYIICSSKENVGDTEKYYILFSDIKFDENCRRCNIDNYNRYKLYVPNKLKDFIKGELEFRPNIDLTYVETEDNYDIWELS